MDVDFIILVVGCVISSLWGFGCGMLCEQRKSREDKT